MFRFWDSITKPVLECARPSVIVEIGSFDGNQTKKVFEFCKSAGAKIHVVDPAPRFDIEKDYSEHAGTLIFHRALSVDALVEIGRMDALLIDGDHNWYTVFNELTLIEESADKWGHPFPLCVLHDVGWPYARRDLYYDPSTIPEAYRQQVRRKGVRPGKDVVCHSGGFNAHLCHAEREGGPRNGVRTAIDDFLQSTKSSLECLEIPVLFGLLILVPTAMRQGNSALDKKLTQIETAVEELAPLLRTVERDRVNALVTLQETQYRLQAQTERVNTVPVKTEQENLPSYDAILSSRRWRVANAVANSINKVVGTFRGR